MSEVVALWLKQSGDLYALACSNGGKPLTCTRGCSACCSERLQTTRQEAEHAWSTLSPGDQAALVPVITAWAERFMGSENFEDEDGKTRALEYRRRELVCPFLRENLCMVYEARPLGCRFHAAVGPRVACEDLALRPHQTFAMAPNLAAQRVLVLPLRLNVEDLQIADLGLWLAILAGVVKEEDVPIRDKG